MFVFIIMFNVLFLFSVHESAAGHGREDGEPGRQPWLETWHAARHGSTGTPVNSLVK